MGLLRRMYNKREMARALHVLGPLPTGELLITTQISNLLAPWGNYAEGHLVPTTHRLDFREAIDALGNSLKH
jgi:hypothetical protein